MKHFLKILNALALLTFSYICVLFQTTILHQCFGIYKPDLLLIVLTYLAMNRFSIEGGVLAYILGYFVGLNSGAPFGLYAAVFVMTFYTTKLISESFFISHIFSKMLLVVVATLISKIYILLVLSVYASIEQVWSHVLLSTISIIALNFLLTPIIFFVLKNMDMLMAKTIPSKTGSKEPQIRLYT